MGLKSGSRDSELDEADEVDDERRPVETESDSTPAETPSEAPTDDATTDGPARSDGSQRPSMESIPYKLRRETVNEGRKQVPYFLRESVIEADDELQDTLEDLLGEDVYKSDYREAAMVVAQRNPELVADVLREWGYDLDAI